MRTLAILALAAGLTGPTAGVAVADTLSSPADNDPNRINVSCYRGAFRNVVAWDRPNAVFVNDLVQLGYSYPDAHAIGERVCRDERGIGNAEHKISTLRQLMAETPPKR